MASGLDNLFTTYGNEYGALGAYQGGQRRGLADTTTRLTNEQKQAETQRYTGETPSYLRKGEAAARTAELANLQPEAEARLGVPEAKAGVSAKETQLKVQQAQTALDQWPLDAKLQYLDKFEKNMAKFNETGLQLLQFSGSTGEAIQRMVEAYPEATKDAQFQQWAKKYENMPRDQALNAFKFEMQKYASGVATTRERFQTEALQEDQKQQGREKITQMQGQAGLAEAQTKAASAGGSTNATEARLILSQQYMEALSTGDTEKANQLLWQLNAISDNAKAATPSPIPGFPGKPGDIIQPYTPGGSKAEGVINLDGPQPTQGKAPSPAQAKPKVTSSQKPVTPPSKPLNAIEEIRATQRKELAAIEAKIHKLGSTPNISKGDLAELQKLVEQSTTMRRNLGQ